MQIGKPLKKWRVNMMSSDFLDDIRIGTLMQFDDFFLFAPLRDIVPEDGVRESIVYPNADDVKQKIKLDYGYANKFSLSAVEYFF